MILTGSNRAILCDSDISWNSEDWTNNEGDLLIFSIRLLYFPLDSINTGSNIFPTRLTLTPNHLQLLFRNLVSCQITPLKHRPTKNMRRPKLSILLLKLLPLPH